MEQSLIEFRLTRAEALVLFDWLVRFDASDATMTLDKAEQKVLWLLEGALEKRLVEILAPNYDDILAEARRDVSASMGE